jgi:hypothetical protein
MIRCIAFLMALFGGLVTAMPARAQDVPSAPAPARSYAQPPFLRSALLSPDGTMIAAQLWEAGRSRIGIWTLDKGPEQQPRTIPADNLTGIEWAGNRRLLVSTMTLAIIANSGSIYVGPTGG